MVSRDSGYREEKRANGYAAGSGSRSGKPAVAEKRPEREYRRTYDAGMEEAIRQRERERSQRARMARERLERERREDERRARMESAAGMNRKRPDDFDDDFEFLDLN